MKRRRIAILGSMTAAVLGSCGAPPVANPQVQVPVSQPSPNSDQIPRPAKSPAASLRGEALPIDTLAKGSMSEMRQPGYEIIRSDGELQSLIQQSNIKDADRAVDWDNEMVLAVFAGERPGSIEVTSIIGSADAWKAKVTYQKPADDSHTTTAITRPYHLVIIPRTDMPIDVTGLPGTLAVAPPASPAASAPAPAASAVAPPVAQGSAAPWTAQIIALGAQSGVKQAVNVIIRTADEWNAVWGTHSQGLTQAAAQPAVDLNQQTVIGIFLGEGTSAGSIVFDSIQPQQNGITVKAHVVPGTPGAKTSPFAMVAIPKTDLPVLIQVQGGPQATTLGNPDQGQAAAPAQQASLPTYDQAAAAQAAPGFGQPVSAMPRAGFGQPVAGSSLGGLPGGSPYLGGANVAPAFPLRGSLLAGTGSGGLLGPGGYAGGAIAPGH